MLKFTTKNYRRCVSLVGLLVTCFAVFIFHFQPSTLHQLDFEIYDYFLEQSVDNTIHPVPVIVDIDEKSLEKYGQWPWSRYLLAQLTDNLLEQGALVVALDIVLAEKDRTSPSILRASLEKYLGIKMNFVNLPQNLYDNDQYLAEKIKEKPIVLGSLLSFDKSDSFSSEEIDLVKKLSLNFSEYRRKNAPPPLSSLLKGRGITMPLPMLAEHSNLAFFNANTSDDGIIRSVPLVAEIDGKILPSLALKACLVVFGENSIRLNSDKYGLQSISIGSEENRLNIPVSPQGMMNVPFKGPSGTYPYISAKDILDKTVDSSLIENKIVFLGSSATGLLDTKATPLDYFFPGVEAHAHVLDAILSQDFIITPHWAIDLQFILLFLNGLIFTIIFAKIRPAYTLITFISLIGLYFSVSWYFYQKNYFFSPLWQLVLLFLLALFITALRFWWEEKDKRKLRNIFGRYVSPEVISRIVEHSDIMLEGEERELSIMFTDVRGFTSISEKLPPQEIVSLLNSYFTPMTALVRSAEGTLDKFIGDAIMAFWNAPLTIENHAQKAIQTAMNMLDELDNINVHIKKNYEIELNMGVGIHVGPAYVGNMGSTDLTSYTVIGDSVNTASRLEGLCSKFGFRIIVSGEAVKQSNVNAIPMAVLRVKGRALPIEIFAVLSKKEEELFQDEIKEYLKAYQSYRVSLEKQDVALLDKTIQLFEELSQKYKDRGLYASYVENCRSMKFTDSINWDGIWTLTNK